MLYSVEIRATTAAKPRSVDRLKAANNSIPPVHLSPYADRTRDARVV